MYIESLFYRKYYDEYEIIPFYLFAVNNYHIFTKNSQDWAGYTELNL